MFQSLPLMLTAFVAIASLILLVSLMLPNRQRTLDDRLDEFSGDGGGPSESAVKQKARSAKAKTAAMMATDDNRKAKLRSRMIQAGLYHPSSRVFYNFSRMGLMAVPVLLGLFASSLGLITYSQAMIFGSLAGLFGTIVPGLWLDRQKSKRQTEIRRAMPDALDVIVVCLEGGLSLPGSVKRVAGELRTAHPRLAAEMNIVQREIQLGRSTGEALERFADRFDVAELRSLASVIVQAERFGASIINALKVHADTMRLQRRQKAEELAAKASVKLVFPTVLFIFPALFVVLIGPAVFDVIAMFQKINPPK